MPSLFNLTCLTNGGTGGGTATGDCGASVGAGGTPTLLANPNLGSTFAGWSCVGDGTPAPFSATSASSPYTFPMPSENVACTATFNLAAPPPPVSASMESNLALALTVLGITAIAGFKKWRNKKA
jgi:hypothetical protein